MQNKTIFTFNDHLEVQTLFRDLQKTNSYAESLKNIKFTNVVDNYNKLSLSGCEVFIIEDNIEHIVEYFNIFEKAAEVKAIYACTKKGSVDFILKLLKQAGVIDKTHLFILDFDLNETSNNANQSVLNAISIYEMIIDTLCNKKKYRVFAVTAYENNAEQFISLKNKIRDDVADLVLNKEFLDTKSSKSLLENLFRNVPGLYTPIQSSTPKRQQQEIQKSTELIVPRSINNNKRKKIAEEWLDHINAAMIEGESFQISRDFNKIKRKNGKPFQSYQEVCEIVETYKIEIDFLLKENRFKEKWQPLRQQIKSQLFKTQLQL